MNSNDEPCKGCGQPTHPLYIKRYGGYCLDCENAGVPDRDMRIAELEADDRLSSDTISRQATLLTGVVNAIKGDPPERVLWSHHDAPQLAAAVVQDRAKLLEALRAIANAKPSQWAPPGDVVDFKAWAQNIARHAIMKSGEEV